MMFKVCSFFSVKHVFYHSQCITIHEMIQYNYVCSALSNTNKPFYNFRQFCVILSSLFHKDCMRIHITGFITCSCEKQSDFSRVASSQAVLHPKLRTGSRFRSPRDPFGRMHSPQQQ